MKAEWPSQSNPRILIIGVGNAYRRDDAVGLIVAQRLGKELPADVTIREASGDGAALIELWNEADAVILIDAVRSGATPGTVCRFEACKQSIPAVCFRSSTHAFSVAEAIELARVLQRLPAWLVVYGIEGKNFTVGVSLSPEVDRAVGELVERVRHEVVLLRSTQGERRA
jgi:hydrogenase maturation protease